MKWLFIWMMGIAVLNLMGICGGRWVGSDLVRESPPISELTIRHCQHPCWQNVMLGQPAPLIWPDSPHFVEQYYSTDTGIVKYVTLQPLQRVNLGNLIVIWGPPSHIEARYSIQPNQAYPQKAPRNISIYLYFQNGLVVAHAQTDESGYISPYQTIRYLEYYAPHPDGNIVPLGTERWTGFGPRYLPFVPNR